MNYQSSYQNNKINFYKNENLQKEKQNNKVESIIIPLELKNQKLNTYLSISNNIDNNSLYVNLRESKEDINKQINEIEELLIKHEETIKKYNNMIKENERNILEIDKETNKKELEISNLKNEIIKKENQKREISSQINELNKIISNPNTTQSSFLQAKFNNIPYSDLYIIKCLQKDLTDYQIYIREQISYKKPIISEIINNLQNCVNEINSDYKVNLYGSYCTGLCLPWSDIDTVITNNSNYTDDFFLSKLYRKLTTKNWVLKHKFIENTNIPIIKLVSNDKFNFHIDISIENEKHFGLKTVELIKSYLNTYSVLEPIILALKTLLNNGSLNNPYTGGLSSYGLTLMVVSFIQSEIDSGKFNNENPNILGETFLNVLGHYGIFFDFNKYIILTYPVNNDIEKDNNNNNIYQFGSNNHELIIVDPLNKVNNVAKSTFQFMNIKMAFMIAYMVAKEDCECGCHYGIIQNKIFNTEHCILKRIFNSVKRFSDASKSMF